MQPTSTLHFSKMHGAGNDFVILDLRHQKSPSSDLCRALSDRHTGIGCDMIIGIKSPRHANSIASYELWTPNGLSSQQCGNGARCIAAWIVRAGWNKEATQFTLDSPSGTHKIHMLDTHMFRIDMGIPQFTPPLVPLFGFDTEQDLYEANLGDGQTVIFSAVSMGNPHAVIEVKNIDVAPVTQIGQALQNSRFFLPSVNVGFTEIVSHNRINLRVYEYGAGETLSCGSGACAAAAVLMRQERVDRHISVALPGGELYIDWPDETQPMTLTGPAAFTFEGEFSYASL
ncbi:MAG TPA: diaminopimelate epimerase [Legionellaceae bacterium]|nr:diaminopimelate epimerase [Legionellaceae bacterium]